MCSGIYQAFRDFAGPVATIIGALAAVGVTSWLGIGQSRIAKQQAKFAEEQAQLAAVRLRHELFDRRFALFAAARRFLVAEAGLENNPTTESIFAFSRETATAIFLVDAALAGYLETFRKEAFELQRLHTMINLLQGGEAEKINQKRLIEWFGAQPEVLVNKFRPFLKLY